MKKILFLILLVFFIDACRNNNQNLEPKDQKALTFYFLQSNLDSLSQDKKEVIVSKIIKILERQPKDSVYVKNMFKVANRYWNMSDFTNFKKTINNLTAISVKRHDTLNLIKSYLYNADYFSENVADDSVFFYYNKLEKIYARLEKKHDLSKILLAKAILQYKQRDVLNCEKNLYTALKLSKGIDDPYITYQCFNLLGICNTEFADYKSAKAYYNKAFSLATERKRIKAKYQAVACSYNNIGLLYRDWGRLKEAIYYFEMALSQKDLAKQNIKIYASLIDNLYYTKMKAGYMKDVERNLLASQKIRKSVNDMCGLIISNIHLSEYYRLKNLSAISKEYATQANQIAIGTFEIRDQLKTLKQLMLVDNSNNLNYFSKYCSLQDSLQNSERNMRNKFARIEYETEELQIENKNLLTYQQKLSIFGSIAMALLVAGFISRHLIARRREYLLLLDKEFANKEMAYLLEKQNEKLETVRKHEKERIAQELHDGVMGKLSGIRLNLFLLEKSRDEKTVANCLAKIKEIQDVEREIRTIAYDLDNSLLTTEASFDSLVKNLFASLQEYTNIRFHYYCDPMLKLEKTGNIQKVQLYRILQEALHNIEKYAGASVVSVNLKRYNGYLFGYIRDNGRGFNPREITKGIGLKSMNRRVAELKGSLKIKTHKNKGTSIKFNMPLNY